MIRHLPRCLDPRHPVHRGINQPAVAAPVGLIDFNTCQPAIILRRFHTAPVISFERNRDKGMRCGYHSDKTMEVHPFRPANSRPIQ